MSIELRVKAGTLAAEARIIRRYEAAVAREKARQRAKFGNVSPDTAAKKISLHDHRVHIVRKAARATHLARMFLKDMPYKRVEEKCYEEPDWDMVLSIAKRYAPTKGDIGMLSRFIDIKQEFTRWKNA